MQPAQAYTQRWVEIVEDDLKGITFTAARL